MLVVAGAFIVAGIAKGAIGIGLPPIAIGLMTLALPLGDALAKFSASPDSSVRAGLNCCGRSSATITCRSWS